MAVSDQDFKAAFSLLPVVIRLAKNLSTSPADPQQQAQLIQIVRQARACVCVLYPPLICIMCVLYCAGE